ncbi:MAG: tRNA pseudouridine(55) synthase TruB [Candidatus Paceibacterota bacterium]
MEKLPENIILIDKPVGITSFDCIRRLRRVLGMKKMGHAGTLDPLASGLMIIGVGKKGTRALNQFKGAEKTYQVRALFGKKTDTGDTDGQVVEEVEADNISFEEVEKALSNMLGENLLPVPIYSAVKKEGKPLYWYARKGLNVETPEKEMSVKEASLSRVYEENGDLLADIFMTVSSGAYVRSLVEELGRRLSSLATVSALRRTKINDISVDRAFSLEEANLEKLSVNISD